MEASTHGVRYAIPVHSNVGLYLFYGNEHNGTAAVFNHLHRARYISAPIQRLVFEKIC